MIGGETRCLQIAILLDLNAGVCVRGDGLEDDGDDGEPPNFGAYRGRDSRGLEIKNPKGRQVNRQNRDNFQEETTHP